MKRKIFFCFVSAFLLISCGDNSPRTPNERFMTTSNIEYIDKFPKQINLSTPETIDTKLIGMRGFKIVDSLMVFSVQGNDGLLAFYSKDDMKPLGRFLNVGNSKEEVLYGPTLSTSVNFYRNADSLYVDVFDGQKGRMLTFNVDESLQKKQGILKSENKSLSNNVFNIARLPDGKYFIKELDDKETRQTRAIMDLKSGKTTCPPIMKRLNESSIKEGEDFNILSTITAVDKGGRIIEMPIGLNYLNLYNPDGSFAKTVCIGEELDDIDEIISTNKAKRKYTFSDVRVFDTFFGVVYINEMESIYQTKSIKIPSILLFTLDGKPMAEIKLKRQATSFDIDMNNHFLYTYDSKTQELSRYKISL